MKKTSKTLALLLALCLCLSLGAFAASGEASGDVTVMSMNADAAASGTAWTMTEDGLQSADVDGVEIVSGEIGATETDGAEINITAFSVNGFKVTGGEYTIRNTTVNKTVTGPIDANAAGGYIAGVTNGRLVIDNCTFINAGKGGRNGNYTVDCEASGEMVVINSDIIQTGFTGDPEGYTAAITDPPSNAGLLISGYARANMSVGQSKTYYYGSYVETEGWAAMSTDSAQSGFEFYSYDSVGKALYGGYGTYADTSCVDWFYGSVLSAAEVGAIISNNGEIHMANGADATEDALVYLPEGYENTADYTARGGRSAVEAGRNDFQIHSPDMMGGGASSEFTAILDLAGTDLVTSEDLDAEATLTDWYADYGPAYGEYVDFLKGANILVKSTSADITLTDVTTESSSGVLLLTALNSDSMSRYALADDDMTGKGTHMTVSDSEVSGDVLAYDYQRSCLVTLENATWTGAFRKADKAAWDAMWSDECKADANCVWILDTDKYYDGADSVQGLVVGEGAVWNVSGESHLDLLTIADGAVINGTITVDGEPIDGEAGVYEGDIVVMPAAGGSDKLSLTISVDPDSAIGQLILAVLGK